jgi:hypothetical protein
MCQKGKKINQFVSGWKGPYSPGIEGVSGTVRGTLAIELAELDRKDRIGEIDRMVGNAYMPPLHPRLRCAGP